MLKSIEGNFDHPEVNELLIKHFVELRAASPEGSAHVLDISGLLTFLLKQENFSLGYTGLKFFYFFVRKNQI